MSWEDPVYGTCQVTDPAGDGTYRCTSFIVIRICGAIARFTQLHIYDLRASPRTSKEPSASGGTRLRLITGILNLALGLRCPRPEPGLAHILSLTKEELEDCFEAKARGTEDGKGVSSGTMERTVRAVAGFLLQVRKDHPEEMALREEDLVEAAEARDRYGRRTMALRPAFTVPDAGKTSLPFRDLPGKAALFLIQTAFRRAPFISLADHSPHLLGEWDAGFNAPLTPDTVSYGSSKKVHWVCSARGHHFMAMVKNRTRLGSGCPYCKGNAVMPGENDLATLRPDLALEWDEERNYPDLPSQCSPHSNRRFWWTCPCDPSHHWYASVNNRTNGSGCPCCDIRRPPMLRFV